MTATRVGALLAAAALTGCLPQARRVAALPPLQDDGEVLLYLEPLPAEAVGLEVAVASVAALARDGRAIPLEVVRERIAAAPPPHQRLLARGRLPPGEYAGLSLGVSRATLERDGARTDLAVPAEPSRIEAGFSVDGARATVLWAALEPRRWLEDRTRFVPALSVAAPPKPVPGLVGYCTNTATHDLTVFDRVRQRVLAVVPALAAPEGIALDAGSTRAFVVTAPDAAVQVLDVAGERVIGRVRLDPGDQPRDAALTPDGRLLVVVNALSNTAVFVDPTSWQELGRVRVGDGPAAILMDRLGQRAYVLNRGEPSITVLDLAYRAAVATVPLEAEPVRAALDRDGALLYVVQRGSQYLAVHALPDLALRRRIFVGLGATAVAVDPRTGRIYVASSLARVDVLDPAASLPVGAIDLPGPASDLTVVATEHLLFAVMPGERAVAVAELASGRTIAVFDVGGAPYELAIGGAVR